MEGCSGDLATVGTGGDAPYPAQWVLRVASLLATVAVTVSARRIARRALKDKLAS